ncbi:MAG: hypothetical protein ACXVEF_23910 [Polyangiales bacterium]
MRSTLAKLAIVASAVLFAGCAVQSAPADTDPTDGSQSELTKFTAKYLGTWNFDGSATDTVKFYNQLTLKAGSEYSATKSPACKKGAICPMYLMLETGKWSVTPKGELTLKPEGGTKKVFTSSVSDDGTGLKIVDSTGHEYFTRLARAGEHCGGFIANAKQCEEGLVCFLGTTPDAGGTCVKPAAEGESCGFRVQNKPCVDGLDCVHVSGPLDSLTCAAPATSEGKFCGGIAGIVCPAGYGCVLDGTYPDAGGKCHACPVIDCAAPPAGCHYESTDTGACTTSCGKLVCDGSL